VAGFVEIQFAVSCLNSGESGYGPREGITNPLAAWFFTPCGFSIAFWQERGQSVPAELFEATIAYV
jgi:hypothetical protein